MIQKTTANRLNIIYVFTIGIISLEFILLEYILSEGILSNDGYNYIAFIRSVLNVGWEGALERFPVMKGIPPILFLIMIGGTKLGLSIYNAGILCNVLGTIIACQGVLFLCLLIYKSKQTAFYTSLMIICLPKIYFEGCGILRDPLYWAEVIWCLFFMIYYIRISKRIYNSRTSTICLLWSTSLAALSCLTRKEGTPFLILVLLIYFYIIARSDIKPIRRLFYIVLIISLSGSIVFLPHICGIPFIPGEFILYSLLDNQ